MAKITVAENFDEGLHEIEHPPINWLEAVRRLNEAGIDIEYDDFLGEDDNDKLGNLVTLAYENGMEPEELFTLAHIPIDKLGEDG